MANPSHPTPCPCGSGQPRPNCCGPYLQGTLPAPTAEALMRSRYTAYCQKNIDYLIDTQHPTHRTLDSRRALTNTANHTTWLGLTVLATRQGQPQDKTGMVEFVVVYQQNGTAKQLHERSQFRQQRGRWFYTEGEILPPLQPKRNEPCWCESGKKFKQCHGKTS